MEPTTLRVGAAQLRDLLDGWQHSEVQLRAVQPEETNAAAALILETNSEIRALTDAAIRGTRASCAVSSRSGDLFCFVEQKGVPVGVLRGELYPAGDGQREFYVSHISVRPQFRSARLGTRLMSHVQGWARSVGARAITLDFMADNPRAGPFYRRLGFEIVGYDLLRKLAEGDSSGGGAQAQRSAPAEASQAAPRVRAYEPADAAQLVPFLQQRQGLSTFEQPCWSEGDLLARLRAAGTDPQQRLFLAEHEGMLVGLCWSLAKLSKAGARLEIALCFESDELRAAALLLDALQRLAVEHSALEQYVTLWEPCGGKLELALARGYRFGRYKLRKRLA